ncbi:carbonic anhydrase [Rhodococcus sp. PAMC28707]|nr:carbonic anhydrase [Rhodococcus sp. PAMC28705]QCB59960.1 carbonic anhydrase [Rhodococcus sp. PAMC28707]
MDPISALSPTPAQAWGELRAGNERFVSGDCRHPRQGIDDRTRLVDVQRPKAVMFGCSDSRVAAEIVFDQGLGDLFVVRTAGHVVDASVLGSIEYAVDILDVPLIAVLGHDSCGAVRASVDAVDGVAMPGGYIRDIVERVTPSILAGRRIGLSRIDEFEARHVEETVQLITARSRLIADRIERGALAVVGLTYRLEMGRVVLHSSLGDVGENFIATLTRWTDCGGTWRLISRTATKATVALCSCDGHEEMQRLESEDPVTIAWIENNSEVVA